MKTQEQNSDIDIMLMIRTADAFAQTGYDCNEQDKEMQSSSLLFASDAYYAIPAIVNLSFACELLLKALIIKSNKKIPHSHSLIDLFVQLPDEQRCFLQQEYTKNNTNAVSMVEVLKIHQKSFEKWRYIFENKNKSSIACPDNLILVMRVIRDKLNE